MSDARPATGPAGDPARLDPRRPEDAAVLVERLLEIRGPDPARRELVFRCLAAPAGSELATVAHALAGLYRSNEGEPDDASRHFRVALAAAGGRGDRLEAAIAINLAKCSLLLGREYEAIVASRRGAANCRERGDEVGLCHALGHGAMAALEVRDWTTFDAHLAEIEALRPGLPPPHDAHFERVVVCARADAALTSGRAEECLRLVDRAEALGPSTSPFWAPLFRAHALLALTRFAEAEALLDGVADGKPEGRWANLYRFVRAMLAARRGDDAESVRAFVESLEVPEVRAETGSGRRSEMASEVARALGERAEARSVVRRALDVAAAAFLERIGELDRFATELPAFAEPDVELRRMLGHHRTRLVTEEQAVLEAAGRLFAAAVSVGDATFRDLVDGDALVCVCAWCRRVRARGRDWVPLAHFLPPTEAITLTHGLCPSCRARLRR